ncbi:MAG: hypothetical protein N2606_05260 [Candidatus Omnitrophica bacterium]|nr:hypothetical protein [Candidatus Omnitrophota bacterium]
MIYIISLVMVFVSLIGGAVLMAAGPNVKAIVDKDFKRKVDIVANIAALEYANVALRANTVITDKEKKDAGRRSQNSEKKFDLGWVIKKDNSDILNQTATMYFYRDQQNVTMIDAEIKKSKSKQVMELF